jgi:hypothetical protein
MTFLLLAVGAFVSCSPAYADAVFPMIILVWPASWLLLLLIIPLEAIVAVRILKIDYKRSLKLAGIANLASVVAGVPVTWFGLGIVEHLVDGGRAWGIATPMGKVFAATVQSPWLYPYNGAWAWLVPAAAISLCIPFFFMSVWVEYKAAEKYSPTINKRLLLNWSWLANTWSYGLIVIGLIITAVIGAMHS